MCVCDGVFSGHLSLDCGFPDHFLLNCVLRRGNGCSSEFKGSIACIPATSSVFRYDFVIAKEFF